MKVAVERPRLRNKWRELADARRQPRRCTIHQRAVYRATVATRDRWVIGAGELVAGARCAVRAVALDGSCRTAGLDPADGLKIDVEGFEGLLRSRPHLGLELHCDELARFEKTVAPLLEAIKLDGYALTFMHRPDWDTESTAATVQVIPNHGTGNPFVTSASRLRPAHPTPLAGAGPAA